MIEKILAKDFHYECAGGAMSLMESARFQAIGAAELSRHRLRQETEASVAVM